MSFESTGIFSRGFDVAVVDCKMTMLLLRFAETSTLRGAKCIQEI